MRKDSAKVADLAREKTAFFAVDVSKEKLDLYSRFGEQEILERFSNSSREVKKQLKRLAEEAREAGCSEVVVVCEPTGGFEKILLVSARRLGLKTAWVSGESVCKMRVVESNDTGKTDLKDPRIIHTLCLLGKTLKHREFAVPYAQMREWHRIYTRAERDVVRAKGAIHRQLRLLFPDLSPSKDFLFSASGRAVMKLYGLNPFRIHRAGASRFVRQVRKVVAGIQKKTLDRIYQRAEQTVESDISEDLNSLYERHLLQRWEDLDVAEKRKEEAKRRLEHHYEQAREQDPKLPEPQPKVISKLHLARIVAETGPLSDFRTNRQLLRFAGLNLRERQSGQYRGPTRVSKKGRSRLRIVLSQVALPLVRQKQLFGPYFHRKRKQENMPGPRAMVAVMRKFLKLLFGWYRSGKTFDAKRVFVCKAAYPLAA